jgi:hypothetical protein
MKIHHGERIMGVKVKNATGVAGVVVRPIMSGDDVLVRVIWADGVLTSARPADLERLPSRS